MFGHTIASVLTHVLVGAPVTLRAPTGKITMRARVAEGVAVALRTIVILAVVLLFTGVRTGWFLFMDVLVGST